MDKEDVVYIHNELLLLLSHKKSDIFLFAIMISELSHRETNTIFVELRKYNIK